MDYNKNTHYTNKHGKQLADFLTSTDPDVMEEGSVFNAIKYHIRAGKKAGESKEKDLGKRDDYINWLLGFDVTTYQSKQVVIDWLDEVKEMFEDWK